MGFEILDGSGTGLRAKVDSNYRLHTHSVSESISENASSNGESYNVNTGTINLTSSSESSVVYLKNTDEKDLLISTIGYLLGNSTGGTGNLTIDVYKNPSAGTLISDAVNADIIENKNTGSNNTLEANVYKGGEGKTCTGGTLFYSSLIAKSAGSYIVGTGNIVVPKGKSICVKISPQALNTSMDVQVFISVSKSILD
jgi:hypothetical protein